MTSVLGVGGHGPVCRGQGCGSTGMHLPVCPSRPRPARGELCFSTNRGGQAPERPSERPVPSAPSVCYEAPRRDLNMERVFQLSGHPQTWFVVHLVTKIQNRVPVLPW